MVITSLSSTEIYRSESADHFLSTNHYNRQLKILIPNHPKQNAYKKAGSMWVLEIANVTYLKMRKIH